MILYKKTSSNLCLCSLSSPLNVQRDLGSAVKPAACAHQTQLIRAAHLAGADAVDRVQPQFNADAALRKPTTKNSSG